MYDALHMGALIKSNDEKHSNANVDGIIKIIVKDEKKTVKYEKKPESIWSDWNEITITIINTIISERSRSKAYDLMKVLLKEKHVTLNNDYIVTY